MERRGWARMDETVTYGNHGAGQRSNPGGFGPMQHSLFSDVEQTADPT